MTGTDLPRRRFDDLPLSADLRATLTRLGYEEPTPIQQAAIEPLLAGEDLIGQAATGTGKTAAFALPIVERLGPPPRAAGPVALIVVPTRELAMQVSQAVHTYGRDRDVRVVPVYGGQPVWRQLKAISRGVDVVVATPGRAVDLLGRGALSLDTIEVVVLDEADEMLDMGFAEDLDRLLGATPPERQTVLFSATLPADIDRLARDHLRSPRRLSLGGTGSPADGQPLVEERGHVVKRAHKPAALGRVLDIEAPDAAIVFCGTRTEVDELTEVMNGRGYRAEALHGGMDQEQRDRVMDRLRSGTAELLVATDVAARGLDIDHLSHVINHDVPSAPESYVHRIGRVGRAGRHGVAITLVEPRQRRLLRSIEQHTGRPIPLEPLPTVQDLRLHRLGRTREALLERLEQDQDLDRFRDLLEGLREEADLDELAAAALALAHAAVIGTDEDDVELPEIRLEEDKVRREQTGRRGGPPRRAGGGSGTSSRIFIGAGARQGIRPKDLVGAIANESSLSGRDIGEIRVTPNFSLVEVPAGAAEEVIGALRGTTIKGQRTTVRHDRNG